MAKKKKNKYKYSHGGPGPHPTVPPTTPPAYSFSYNPYEELYMPSETTTRPIYSIEQNREFLEKTQGIRDLEAAGYDQLEILNAQDILEKHGQLSFQNVYDNPTETVRAIRPEEEGGFRGRLADLYSGLYSGGLPTDIASELTLIPALSRIVGDPDRGQYGALRGVYENIKEDPNQLVNPMAYTPLLNFAPFRGLAGAPKSFARGFNRGRNIARNRKLPKYEETYGRPYKKDPNTGLYPHQEATSSLGYSPKKLEYTPSNVSKSTYTPSNISKDLSLSNPTFNISIPEGLGSVDNVTGKLRPTTANLLSPAARDYMTQDFSRGLDKMVSTFNKNKETGWQKFQDEIIKLNRKEKYKPIAETRARLLKDAENMPQRYGDMDQLPQYIKDNYQYVGFLWEKGLIDANVSKEQLNKLKNNKEVVDEYADRQMRSVRGVHLDADEATKVGGTAEQMADQFLFAQPSLPQDKFELRAGRGQLGRGVYTSNAPGLADRFAGRSSGSMKSYVGDMSIIKPGELEGKSPSEIVDFFDRIGRPASMTEPTTGKTYATLNRQKDNRTDIGQAFKASLAGKEYNPNNPIISEPDLPEGFGLFDVKTEKPVAPDVRYIYQGYNTMAGDTPGQVATERVIIRPQNITAGEKYEKLQGDVFDPTKLGRASGIRDQAADPKYFSNWDQLYKELVSGGYLPQGEKYKNFISDLANLQKQTNKYGRGEAEAINNIKNEIVNSATFVDDLMPKMKSADPFTDAVSESVYYGPEAPKNLISGRQSFLDDRASRKSYNAADNYRPLSTKGISDEFLPTLNYLESLNRPFTQGASNPLADKRIMVESGTTALGDVYSDKTAGLRSRLSGLFEAALPDISNPPSRNPFYNISPSVLGGSPTTSGLLSTFPNRAISVEASKSKTLKDQSVKDDLEYLKQSTFTPTNVYSPSDEILGSPARNTDVLKPLSHRQTQVRNLNRDFKKSSLESFKKRLADSAELARFYADPLNVPAPKTFLGQFEPSQVMGITQDITGKPFTNVADLEKDVKDIINYDRLDFDEQKARFGNIGTRADFLERRVDLQNALSGRGSMFNLVPSKFRDDPLEDLPAESSQGFYTAVMGDKLMEATQVGQELLNREFPLIRKNEHVGKFLDWTDQQKDFQRIFYPQQRILKKYGGMNNIQKFKYGGMPKEGSRYMDVDYEAEGGEVIIGDISVNRKYNGGTAKQYKGANMFMLEGPSHAEGGIGIKMNTPSDNSMNYMSMGGSDSASYVFTDRLKDGKETYADKAAKFGNRLDEVTTMAMGGDSYDRATAKLMKPRIMSEISTLFNKQEEFKKKNNIDQEPDKALFGAAFGTFAAKAGLSKGLAAAQFLPGLFNIGKSVFGKTPELEYDPIIPETQEYQDFNPLMQSYLGKQNRSLAGLRAGLESSGASGSQLRAGFQAGLSGSQANAANFLSQIGQMQSQSDRQTDQFNIGQQMQADQGNMQAQMMNDQFMAQNDPKKAFGQGLSQILGTATSMSREGYQRGLMNQLFGLGNTSGGSGGGNTSFNLPMPGLSAPGLFDNYQGLI